MLWASVEVRYADTRSAGSVGHILKVMYGNRLSTQWRSRMLTALEAGTGDLKLRFDDPRRAELSLRMPQ